MNAFWIMFFWQSSSDLLKRKMLERMLLYNILTEMYTVNNNKMLFIF